MKKAGKIIMAIIILLIALVVCCYFFFFQFKLIGDSEISINVGEKYFENGYILKLFNKKYNDVKIEGSVDTTKMGDYQVTYTYKIFKLKRLVHVVDTGEPVITLKGYENVYLSVGDSYVEEGYEAIDNLDGDITANVKVDSNYEDKEGTYKIVYSVSDNNGNKTEVIRNIEVSNDNMLSSSIKDFRLEGKFNEVILTPDTEEYDYFKDTVFLGDSNTTWLHLHGKYIENYQTWGKINMNILDINNGTFQVYSDKKVYTLDQALSTFKPKYLIVTTGINSALNISKDVYVRELENLIKNVKNNYPDVTLIINATFPVFYGTVDTYHIKTINDYNYYAVKLCRQYRINFINFADTVKTSEGIADEAYFECTEQLNCGFHLNEEGKAKYIDYIKHLDLERKVK